MSCAYRHAAFRVAAVAGMPPELMLMAMDVVPHQHVAHRHPPSETDSHIMRNLLNLPDSCSNPDRVFDRVRMALVSFGYTHPTNPRILRWMALATILGVPTHDLPIPVPPVVIDTVRSQMHRLSAIDPTVPPDWQADPVEAGLITLRQGKPIPPDMVELTKQHQQAKLSWLAHGACSNQLEESCGQMEPPQIATLVRAGVIPTSLVMAIERYWWSDHLPWDAFPLFIWDQIANRHVQRWGKARTAATQVIQDADRRRDDRFIAAAALHSYWSSRVLLHCPDLRGDDRLIAATAEEAQWAARVLLHCPDLCDDDRLIAAAAGETEWAARVLLRYPELRDDDRLIAAAAGETEWAARVLMESDLCDDRLIATAAKDGAWAAQVLIRRTDLSDERLIEGAAQHDRWAAHLLMERTDLSDERLLAAIVRERKNVQDVLRRRPDLKGHPLLAAPKRKARSRSKS